MNIKLEEIDINSGIDGLEVLKEISNDDEIYGESPVPKEINEYLYKGFLLISEEESNLDDTYRYWVTLDDKKIGYANIRQHLDEDARRIGGNIGIVLLKKYLIAFLIFSFGRKSNLTLNTNRLKLALSILSIKLVVQING